jgi:hypothetical protein
VENSDNQCENVWVSVYTELDKMQCLCYSEFAGILCYYVTPCGVMRKIQTTLTYRGDKMRDQYQVLKKIFWGKKNPVRVLYNEVYGTETSPLDEFSYIGICLWEGLNIIGSHYMKKIFPG